MKKLLIVALAICLTLSLVAFTGCKKDDMATDNLTLNIVMPDGAPALAMAKYMSDGAQIEGVTANFEIVAGATEVMARVTNGEADAAIVPTNLAATMYNKNLGIELVSVNVFGVLYLVGTEDAVSLSDLEGKIVYNIGRGGTPDLTFKYILAENGIEYVESDVAQSDKVALKYVSSGSELIPLLKTGVAKYGILGEPAVSQAVAKAVASIKFDLQALWNDASGTTGGIPQASLVVKKSILDQNPGLAEKLVTLLSGNANWLSENLAGVGALISGKGSTLAVTLTQPILDRCNLRVKAAASAKAEVNAYLTVLHGFNAQTVGGKLPDDGFFYEA